MNVSSKGSPAVFNSFSITRTRTVITIMTLDAVEFLSPTEPCNESQVEASDGIPPFIYYGADSGNFDSPTSLLSATSTTQSFSMTPTPSPPDFPVESAPPDSNIPSPASPVDVGSGTIGSPSTSAAPDPPSSTSSLSNVITDLGSPAAASSTGPASTPPPELPGQSSTTSESAQLLTNTFIGISSEMDATTSAALSDTVHASSTLPDGASVTNSGPARSPSSHLPTSSTSSREGKMGQRITMSTGVFAIILVLVSTLAITVVVFAIAARQRRRKRRSGKWHDSSHSSHMTGLPDSREESPQQLGNDVSTAEAGFTNARAPRDANNVRLSVFPGWTKWLSQVAKGKGDEKQHVDFEMVTGSHLSR